MITKNFKIFVSSLLGKTTKNSQETINLPMPIKDVTGAEYSTIYYPEGYSSNCFLADGNNSPNFAGPQGQHSIQLYVGTNDAEVTENDYTLGDITTLSAVGNTAVTRSIVDDGYYISIGRTLTNTSDSDITIKEMGLVKIVYANSSTGRKYLFAREVLDTPLVVPSGASFSITMVIRV